ncbi:DUF4442 domain-containing protein [Psychrobacter sp. I-STPA6b]|uniref:DUF4442 domain-containing protein n=1 Tax=Psychrobacter sp. I-STPA6b TaxID=2585718 RepID=UPI001D0C2437|nr:DUF4442 domain-containing protein [Psychrobacter sp. I-STPA6b]
MTSLFSKLTNRNQDNNNMSNIESPNTQSDTSESTGLKPVNNQFSKILAITKYLPNSVRAKVLTTAFGKIVPFVGTTGVYYESVSHNKIVVSLDNEKNVQNHIGTVHAVAVTLLAETATGFILGLNLPSDRVLLVKSYQVNFYRPLKKGQVAAIATLSDEQRLHILNTPKGEMVIPCVIEDRSTDTNKRDPITVEMTWAWIPKSELKQRQLGNKQNNQESKALESSESTTNSDSLANDQDNSKPSEIDSAPTDSSISSKNSPENDTSEK